MKTLLSISGGGMKGLVPCAILAEIEKRSGKTIPELFDLGFGTSVGGIILESIGAGNSAADTLDFFTVDGPQIFKTNLFTNEELLLRGYRFDPTQLEIRLQARLKNLTMAQSKMKIGVPATDRGSKDAVFFKSFDPQTQHYLMWQVARATSAAQTYFPPYPLAPWNFWDGGNAANNPAVCCYAEAVRLWPGEQFRMLCLGCGGVTDSSFTANPGLTTILSETVALFLDCDDQLPNYQMVQFLGANYDFIQPVGITTGLADASTAALDELAEVTIDAISQNTSVIDKYCGLGV